MATSQHEEHDPAGRRVLVTSKAANMISSLHPSDRRKADATLARVKSSVLDQAKVEKIVGVENAFVARAGRLRVVFTNQDDAVIITSIVTRG